MEADNLKKATRNMGNSVYRALCEVTSITAPPGVNRRAKCNEGDKKFMWNGRGFHNLSVLIDAIKAHDPQLIRAAHDIFAARAGTRRPVGRPPKAPAPAQAPTQAPMQVVDFAGAVRGTIAAKIQALTAYLGALEGRNGAAIAASPFARRPSQPRQSPPIPRSTTSRRSWRSRRCPPAPARHPPTAWPNSAPISRQRPTTPASTPRSSVCAP